MSGSNKDKKGSNVNFVRLIFLLMQKNKKIFLLLFVLFMLVILYVSYDISRRTTFPGSKGNLKERISTEVEK
jgi:hypothetical protein